MTNNWAAIAKSWILLCFLALLFLRYKNGSGDGAPSNQLRSKPRKLSSDYFVEKAFDVDGVATSPRYLTVYNDKLYFAFSSDGPPYVTPSCLVTGRELWSYDSSTGTAEIAADINTNNGQEGSSPEFLTVYNGKLYFTADDGSGIQLWSYDSAACASSKITDFNIGGSMGYLVVYNDKLYFRANDGVFGIELWSYDDSSNTVERVTDINTSGDSFDNGFAIDASEEYFVEYNGKLYFQAKEFSSADSFGLWSYESTTRSVAKIANISPSNQKVYAGKLYFRSGLSQLWSYDSATSQLTTVATPWWLTSIAPFAEYESKLYFSAQEESGDDGLWRYDASTDTLEKAASSDALQPGVLVTYNNRLYFANSYDALGVYDASTNEYKAVGGNIRVNSGFFTIYNNNLYFDGSGVDYSVGEGVYVLSNSPIDTPGLFCFPAAGVFRYIKNQIASFSSSFLGDQL